MPHSETIAIGGATASAMPAIAGPLRELLQHDVARWPDRGLRRIKQRTVRSVFAGQLGTVAVHIKVYRTDSFADRTRDLLRGRPGGREAGNLATLRALGLPAVEPLAFGLALDQGRLRSFVITATIDGAPFAWPASAAAAAAAGALLRHLHDRGIAPTDLHPGNLLVQRDGALLLLDVPSLPRVGDLDLRTRARGLAFFCQQLDGGASDPTAAPLLAGYSRGGPPLPPTLRAELDRAHRQQRAAALPKFGRRAFRNCRQTEVEVRRRATPQWHWQLDAAPALEPPRGGPSLDRAEPRATCIAFAAAPPPPTRSGRRGAVWLQPTLAVKERSASHARALWRASYWLAFAGVPAPAPVALRLHLGRGLVFWRRLPGRDLGTCLGAQGLPLPVQIAIGSRLGQAVGRLHAHGLRNRDLKLANLLFDPTTGEVAMVDLDGIARRHPTESRGRGRDVGRLWAACQAVGATDGRLVRAFLRGWLRAHRRLRQRPDLRRMVQVATARAAEWAAAHRSN